jgi:hypothetical protein
MEMLTRRLHADGWAAHVTVQRLLAGWVRLSDEVGSYGLTIYDYTNDLMGRDALDLVLSWASGELTDRLLPAIQRADERFAEATIGDDRGVIGRYFRVDNKSGWWWKRLPRAGRMMEELARGR